MDEILPDGHHCKVQLACAGLILPVGYPDSVTPDYLAYQLWAVPSHITGWMGSSLITSSLLAAVGLKAGAGAAAAGAASIRWITKDGIGALGRLLVSCWYNFFFIQRLCIHFCYLDLAGSQNLFKTHRHADDHEGLHLLSSNLSSHQNAGYQACHSSQMAFITMITSLLHCFCNNSSLVSVVATSRDCCIAGTAQRTLCSTTISIHSLLLNSRSHITDDILAPLDCALHVTHTYTHCR